ncbi:MAG: sigma 54-interacting transcriptional regulator, partial [Candidatus Eisenbacteria bacterium]
MRIAECLRRRGQFEEAHLKIGAALELAGSAADPVLRGRVLWRLGDILCGLGRYEQALAACEEAHELLRSSSEHAEIGFLEIARGTICSRRGDVVRSRECFESALFCFRRIDHREGIALALNNLGLLLKNGPHWADARDFLTRALAVSEAAGDYTRVATHSVNLGILYTKLCNWELAEEHLSRAVSINREVGNSFALVKALLASGLMHQRRAHRERAAALYAEGREIGERHDYRREIVLCDEFEGELLMDEGRFEEARSRLNRGLARAMEFAPDGDLVPELKIRLSRLALRENRIREAEDLAVEGYRGAQHVRAGTEAGVALRLLGESLSLKGAFRPAGRLLERSLKQLERTPERYELALSQIALARHLGRVHGKEDPAAAEGLPERAIELVKKAWTFFASVDLPEQAAEALVELAQLCVELGRLDDAMRDIARARGLSEQLGRRDLLRRLDSLHELLEERSARTANLVSPEADLIEQWGRLFGQDLPADECLAKMLQFVVTRLESNAGVIASPGKSADHEVEAAVGLSRAQAQAALAAVAPFVKENGICLATELGADSRFTAHATGALNGVRALAALRVRLPDGDGLLYLDRRTDGARPYGSAALNQLSLLTGLMALGLSQIRRERDLRRQRQSLLDESARGPFAEYITCHRPLKQVFAHLARVGESTASIIIMGETGTGKGLLAQCIHQASSRRQRPFVTVNCAALPEPLLESELFGHVQGSFTGAIRTKRGLFEVADGGTLLLDEICRASLAVQAKLLHVLDSREVRAVGATHGRKVDTRVICASNIDLREAIRQGLFLEDLFYRLSDFTVELPPLRERREDIPLLVHHFFAEACGEMQRSPKGLSREVMTLLLDHPWRGNIRELMQVVRRLVALSED